MKLTHASLFSGFGGPDLAARWMGWENAFHCEINPFCNTILNYHFPKSKSYKDVTTTDFTPWRGKIDVLTGGFPCQPFSVAGQRKGADDNRYLWPHFLRAIKEIQPTWVIGENVAGILTMVQPGEEIEVGCQASLFDEDNTETVLEQEYVAETICQDLEREGYSVQPIVIPACAVEAPHRRDRVWFIAYRSNSGTESMQRERKNGVYESEIASNANCIRPQTGVQSASDESFRRKATYRYAAESSVNDWRTLHAASWQDFPTQPPVCRGNDGLPFDVVRLTIPYPRWRAESIKGYGNAIVPEVVFELFKAIQETYN